MRKYRKILKDDLEDIFCDVCGNSCIPSVSNMELNASFAEFATLEARWGYFSGQDGESAHYEICEKCFKKVNDFLKNISAGN